jgi:hypothetical protein
VVKELTRVKAGLRFEEFEGESSLAVLNEVKFESGKAVLNFFFSKSKLKQFV